MDKAKYIFQRKQEDGTFKDEDVAGETWRWMALTGKGETIYQFNEADGTFHQMGELEAHELAVYSVYKADGTRRIDIKLLPGQKPFFKYRNTVLNADKKIGEGQIRHRIFIFGYKDGGQHHFNFIMPDDLILQASQDIEINYENK